jgi:chorismate mutase
MPDIAQPPAVALDPAAPAADLAVLRAEIDALDDQLHALLMRRAGIVAKLGSSRAKGEGPALRPGREAAILRRLLDRHAEPLPRAALVRLWREIFAASTAMQASFAVAAAVPPGQADHVLHLTRQHFGADTPIRPMTTAGQALAAVLAGEVAVAALPAPEPEEPEDAAWWVRFDAQHLQVTARLPFLAEQGSRGVLVVASTPPDPSGRDCTLFRIELSGDLSHARLTAQLQQAGLPMRGLMIRRSGAEPVALAEVGGFIEGDDPRLAALAGLHVQRLGAYAEPEPA